MRHIHPSNMVLGLIWQMPGLTPCRLNEILMDPLPPACPGKEYANADSRYASRDSFTICMEFVTAFLEGPSCFLVVYALVRKRPWRHILQLLVATCQIYGDVLYFATSWYEGDCPLPEETHILDPCIDRETSQWHLWVLNANLRGLEITTQGGSAS